MFWRDATSAKRTGCVAMKDRMMEMLEVQIQYVRNQKTGLIVAMSDDHRGLYVHGRTMEEVEERIPQALRALLEAEGKNVIEVSLQDDEAVTKSGFYPSTAKFSASFATAA